MGNTALVTKAPWPEPPGVAGPVTHRPLVPLQCPPRTLHLLMPTQTALPSACSVPLFRELFSSKALRQPETEEREGHYSHACRPVLFSEAGGMQPEWAPPAAPQAEREDSSN